MNKSEFDTAMDRLQRPFATRDIDWVPNFTYGDDNYNDKVIAVAPYIRREAVITRFNVVCGPGNWENFLEPLGKAGLYQAIAINLEGEWVRKWDGAQMDSDQSRIDPVKGAVSRSIRRAGEMWGVGLYLQFIPQLFAIKRPSSYYSSDETWEDRKNNLKIRWDHPQLPKEFIPEYMTPEQYVRMRRILKYLSDEKKQAAEEIIADWESNPDSVSYEDAEITIGLVEDRILSRLKSIDNRKIYAPKQKQDAPSTTKQSSSPDKKGQQAVQHPEQKASPSPKQSSQSPENAISVQQLKTLIGRVEFLEQIDPGGTWHDQSWIQNIKTACNKHHKQVEFITEDQFTKWIKGIKSIEDLVDSGDDDLPF